MIGTSPAFQRALEHAHRLARLDYRVLIEGETGTGKDRFARLIHDRSERYQRPFVAIPCAAIPAEMFEGELFGHRRGAFTGATQDRPGLFRAAHTGTLFLDDVAELPMAQQAKLLRALQSGEVRALGADRADNVNVRVIASSNRPLREEVQAGRFRADLLYRLGETRLELPALRDRSEDVELMLRHYGERLTLSPEALLMLCAYSWPGNVRELQNVCRQLEATVEGEVQGHDVEHVLGCGPARAPAPGAATLPLEFGAEGVDFYGIMYRVEESLIERALTLAGGSTREAARILRMNRTTLMEKRRRRRLRAA